MSYHILLASKENFEICIEKGVYGAVKSSSDKLNAEVISCTLGIKQGDFIFFLCKKYWHLWSMEGYHSSVLRRRKNLAR